MAPIVNTTSAATAVSAARRHLREPANVSKCGASSHAPLAVKTPSTAAPIPYRPRATQTIRYVVGTRKKMIRIAAPHSTTPANEDAGRAVDAIAATAAAMSGQVRRKLAPGVDQPTNRDSNESATRPPRYTLAALPHRRMSAYTPSVTASANSATPDE